MDVLWAWVVIFFLGGHKSTPTPPPSFGDVAWLVAVHPPRGNDASNPSISRELPSQCSSGGRQCRLFSGSGPPVPSMCCFTNTTPPPKGMFWVPHVSCGFLMGGSHAPFVPAGHGDEKHMSAFPDQGSEREAMGVAIRQPGFGRSTPTGTRPSRPLASRTGLFSSTSCDPPNPALLPSPFSPVRRTVRRWPVGPRPRCCFHPRYVLWNLPDFI